MNALYILNFKKNIYGVIFHKKPSNFWGFQAVNSTITTLIGSKEVGYDQLNVHTKSGCVAPYVTLYKL